MSSQRAKLSDQIRRAVDACGMTRYRISMETGIDQGTLSRFMSGAYGLPMRTLDKLADYLNLNITAGKGRKPRKSR